MSSRYYWMNDDGLTVRGGRREPGNGAAAKLPGFGHKDRVQILIKEGETAPDKEYLAAPTILPAGATITDVQLHSDGALTGLVDLLVGVEDYDGGTDLTDPNGLVLAIDAAEVVGLRPSGTVVGTTFDGALLTTSVPLSEEVLVTWSATTASGAGDIIVAIEYVAAQ